MVCVYYLNMKILISLFLLSNYLLSDEYIQVDEAIAKPQIITNSNSISEPKIEENKDKNEEQNEEN